MIKLILTWIMFSVCFCFFGVIVDGLRNKYQPTVTLYASAFFGFFMAVMVVI